MLLFRKKKQEARPLIVAAPDKFKGTLTAREVAAVVKRVIADVMPTAQVRVCPMADGGEGTARVLAGSMNLDSVTEYIPDALGHSTPTEYFTDGKTVALDSSAVVGLQRIGPERRDPMRSSTYPLGELLVRLINEGAEQIYLGIGGTATVDGGAGLLQALGVQFYDFSGREMPSPIRACDLADIFSAEFPAGVHDIVRRIVTGLADVDVPLEGSMDYAPQKGVTQEQMPQLRHALANYQQVIDEALHAPGAPTPWAGAGGGLGYALGRVLGCGMRSGAETVLDTYRLFDSGQGAPELIITGEGCLDRQTLAGKVVWRICCEATARDIPVLVLAGHVELDDIPDKIMVMATDRFLNGQELNRARAVRSLDTAARQALAEICVRLWG